VQGRRAQDRIHLLLWQLIGPGTLAQISFYPPQPPMPVQEALLAELKEHWIIIESDAACLRETRQQA
jgi:hypothetical protein